MLNELYKRASQNPQYLCTFHDASKIKSAKDFFVPILKLKYGEDYNDVLSYLGDTVENILDAHDALDVKEYCKDWMLSSAVDEIIRSIARNPNGKHENDKKLPLIFVDGLDTLFFNLDYGKHADFLKANVEVLSEEHKIDETTVNKIEKILTLDKYTSRLRSKWHQVSQDKGARIHGLMRNNDSPECRYTLSRYDYMFYGGNFCPAFMD